MVLARSLALLLVIGLHCDREEVDDGWVGLDCLVILLVADHAVFVFVDLNTEPDGCECCEAHPRARERGRICTSANVESTSSLISSAVSDSIRLSWSATSYYRVGRSETSE